MSRLSIAERITVLFVVDGGFGTLVVSGWLLTLLHTRTLEITGVQGEFEAWQETIALCVAIAALAICMAFVAKIILQSMFAHPMKMLLEAIREGSNFQSESHLNEDLARRVRRNRKSFNQMLGGDF